MLAAYSDNQLSAAWKAGHRDAGAELFERHAPGVHRYLRRRLGGSASDDLLQDVWLAAARMIHGFEGRSSFRTWLFAIANNHVRVAYRCKKRLHKIQETAHTFYAEETPGPDAIYTRRDQVARLSNALADLPLPMQRLVALYYFERVPAPKIGRMLAIPEDTVRSRIRRARERLGAAVEARSSETPPQQDPLESWLVALASQGVLRSFAA